MIAKFLIAFTIWAAAGAVVAGTKLLVLLVVFPIAFVSALVSDYITKRNINKWFEEHNTQVNSVYEEWGLDPNSPDFEYELAAYLQSKRNT